MSQTGDHAAGMHNHPDCPWCLDEDETAMQLSIAFAAMNLKEVDDTVGLSVYVDGRSWDRLQAAIKRYVTWTAVEEAPVVAHD